MNQGTPDIDLPLEELVHRAGAGKGGSPNNERWRAVLDARLSRDTQLRLQEFITSVKDHGQQNFRAMQELIAENKRLTRWTCLLAFATVVLAIATVAAVFRGS